MLNLVFVLATFKRRLLTSLDDPLAANISGRYPSSTPIDETCLSTITQWVDTCVVNHPSCTPEASKDWNMPTRVIDVGLPTSSSNVRLIATSEDQIEPWIALSYCWGTDTEFFKTTMANVDDLQGSIDFGSLPRTVQDAIKVTRRLNYRYLWVDALCIIQDDPSDKLREIDNMRNIYRNATLTIAADNSGSVNDGFLRDRQFSFPAFASFRYSDAEGNSLGCFMLSEPFHDRNYGSALDHRGWALQELIISPRTSHFGRQQLFWNCQTRFCSEAEPTLAHTMHTERKPSLYPNIKSFFLGAYARDNYITTSLRVSPVHRSNWMLERWYSIVEDYEKRLLSDGDDLFPAIAGLAEEIERQTGLTYLAGLWEEDIHQGLLWISFRAVNAPMLYRAPSWSWAAAPRLESHKPEESGSYLRVTEESKHRGSSPPPLSSLQTH